MLVFERFIPPLFVLQLMSNRSSRYQSLKIEKLLEVICNAKKVDCDEAKALWREKFTYFMVLHRIYATAYLIDTKEIFLKRSNIFGL